MPHQRAFTTVIGLAQIGSWGSLYYSFPQIAEAMSADPTYARDALYGAATAGLLLSGLAAYPVGAAIDRGYGRLLMASGSVLAAVLFLLWSQGDGLAAACLLIAGLGLAQSATLYQAAFAVTARRFGALRARTPITQITLWGGLASTAAVPLVEAAPAAWGWRTTLLWLAAVHLLLCVPA